MGIRVAEFVVAPPEVLHQRVASHDHSCRVVAFQAAHRTESDLEPAMVTLDSVVRVLLHVVKRGGYELIDRSP